jgi:2-polyprenyl-3-methyl-5-hydroxy-6-metoxy-1,4-benzoquinol methylase
VVKKFTIDDIHSPGVADKFDELSIQDIERLLFQRSSFVDSGCPACHSLDVVHEFEYQSFGYRRCRVCEMLYISPAPTESAHLDYVVTSSAMAYWRDSMPEGMKKSRRPMYQDRVEYSKHIFSKLGMSPKVSLEIGAGNGEFAEELADATTIEQIVLLEPQELNLRSNNIQIIKGGFEELECTRQLFDVVFAWEVLEHILEPDNFLRLIRAVLEPGAPLILSTPNERSVETRELGTNSTNILFDHVRLYNPLAIESLFKRNGFRVIEMSTPGKLDVERLVKMKARSPDYFSHNPALNFLLGQGDDVLESFQTFLQKSRQSSHMRVVAVVDGDWNGSNVPLISSSCLGD